MKKILFSIFMTSLLATTNAFSKLKEKPTSIPREEKLNDILGEEKESSTYNKMKNIITTDFSSKLVALYRKKNVAKKSLNDDQDKKLRAIVAPVITLSFGAATLGSSYTTYLLWNCGHLGKITAILCAIGTGLVGIETGIVGFYSISHIKKLFEQNENTK